MSSSFLNFFPFHAYAHGRGRAGIRRESGEP